MTCSSTSRDNRKKLIIKNAKTLLRTQGVFSFKFSSLAKMSNCSNSTLYDVFSCKEDVFLTIFNEHLIKVINVNETLLKRTDLTAKEKFYIVFMQCPLDVIDHELTQVVCNLFSVNRYVVNHADEYLASESSRLLVKIQKQYIKFFTLAIISQEIDLSDEEISYFSLKIKSFCRGLVAVFSNHHSESLGFNIDAGTVYRLLSDEIESYPWINKNKPKSALVLREVKLISNRIHNIDSETDFEKKAQVCHPRSKLTDFEITYKSEYSGERKCLNRLHQSAPRLNSSPLWK